jgi:hypothetical protein
VTGEVAPVADALPGVAEVKTDDSAAAPKRKGWWSLGR